MLKFLQKSQRIVPQNSKQSSEEKSSEEINHISRKFYHHLCDMVLETVKSISISEEELLKRFKPTNIEVVHAIEKKKKDVALMLPFLNAHCISPEEPTFDFFLFS